MSAPEDPAVERPVPAADGAGMEDLIGWLLLIWVLLSISLIAAGEVWNFAATGKLSLQYPLAGVNLFEFVAAEFRRLASGQAEPRLLVNFGLAALLLTPYLRVAASLIYFLFSERNWKYALFTGVVWAILTYSLFLR